MQLTVLGSTEMSWTIDWSKKKNH